MKLIIAGGRTFNNYKLLCDTIINKINKNIGRNTIIMY